MRGKKVVVGVSGGIAAYKAAELVRLLVRAEAHTTVAMTRNATRFVTPLTFEALSGHRVIWDMWADAGAPMDHITLGQTSELIIIAPATANFIAKAACGVGDDFLSTLILAATAKILICPSMNSQMFNHPAVQENLNRLRQRKIAVMEPGHGQLACRTDGPGRLPEPADIMELAHVLLSKHDLSGLRILVTAGPTQEPLDPVRYIGNRSSGKMGYALAETARRRGAAVTLISGPTNLTPPLGIEYREIKTAEQMRDAVFAHRPESDIIIKAAAVSDYRPRASAAHKIKKGKDSLNLELVKNPDILSELASKKAMPRCLLVGFAAETEDLLTHAKKKMKSKALDMIVANDVSGEDAGFETDTNRVKIVYKDGQVEDVPLMTKTEVADVLLDRIKTIWESRVDA